MCDPVDSLFTGGTSGCGCISCKNGIQGPLLGSLLTGIAEDCCCISGIDDTQDLVGPLHVCGAGDCCRISVDFSPVGAGDT